MRSLEAKIEREAGQAGKHWPGQGREQRCEGSARYVAAIGFEVTADRLNDLLVLLAVLMIEAGGGLSLALGMVLGAAPVARALEPADTAVSKRPRTPPVNAAADARTTPDATPNAASVRVDRTRPVSVLHPSELTDWLRLQGGRTETSMRRLADALGRSPSGVHDELRRMVASGLITAASGPRGTVISFAAAGKPN